MSDINLLIEEAADLLTKNERKLQGKKENYTPAELQEMLILQEKQKIENRDSLNKKIIEICTKAKKEFNLSSVPIGMMEQVTLDISNQVKEGYITSVANVEKNEMVIKTVQREATKAQIVENYESEMSGAPAPHETVPLYVESIGYIASNPEVAEAMEEIVDLSESEEAINNIAENITLDNAVESIKKINEIKETQQYIDDRTKKMENVSVVLENGNEEEKRFCCEFIEREVASCRVARNPEDVQAVVDLYQSFLSDLKSKFADPKIIATEMREKLLSVLKLNPEEIVELNDIISDYENTHDSKRLEQYLIDGIISKNPNVSRQDIDKAVEEAVDNELNPERVSKDFLELQARIRLIDNDEFLEYCDYVDQIFRLGANSNELDLQKLDDIKKKSRDLYDYTVRAIYMKSNKEQTKNESIQELFQQTDELINEAAGERQSEVLLDRTSIRTSIENNEIREQESQETLESFYWTFSAAVSKQPENLENLKKQMVDVIKNMEGISDKEKQEEISKIEMIQNRDDVIEYSLDGLEKVYTEKGLEFDREYNREKMNKVANPSTAKEKAREVKREQRDEKAARAKIILTPGEYDRYMEMMERLKNTRLRDTVQLDLELLEHLRSVDGNLYEWMFNSYERFAKDTRNTEMEYEIAQYKMTLKKEALALKHKKEEVTHDESERPAEERTGIINEAAEVTQENSKKTVGLAVVEMVVDGEEVEKRVLQAENSVEDVIKSVTDGNALMEAATVNPNENLQEDSERDEV